MFSAIDEAHMRRALALAALAMNHATPNPRVGCVLVRDGEVLAEGFTQRPGDAHAEAHALRNARTKGVDVRGATAYVTLEPCNHFGKTPPCTEALIGAGVSRVVAAMEDPNPNVSGTGFERLRDAGIEVRVGLLAQDAGEINIGFAKRMQTGLPWVRWMANRSGSPARRRAAMATAGGRVPARCSPAAAPCSVTTRR